MKEDKLRQAFDKIRQDIDSLFYNYQYLHTEIADLKDLIKDQNTQLNTLNEQIKRTQGDETESSQNLDTPSFPVDTSTDTSTHNYPLEAVKSQNPYISTRNKGVSTDRQTDQQTDNTLNQIPKILKSLQNIREEVRIKFKALTKQELVIFTTIYQLEEQGTQADYQILAQKLEITESSIRDHISRIIKKGIPVEKTKENNKRILLRITPSFKEITSLETIQNLSKQTN